MMTPKQTLHTFVVLATLLGFDPGFCDDGVTLPGESKLLVERLEDWESDQRKELAKRIREKRLEVATALKDQLKETTRKGSLDAALAIQTKISELESQGPPTSSQELASWLEGKTIEFNGRSGRHVIEFNQKGAVLNRGKKDTRKVTYEALTARTVKLNWGTDYQLEYSEDMTNATLISPAGKYSVTTSKKES